MNLLAVDFGTKNIGLAWCDTQIGVSLPFGVVDDIAGLIAIIENEKIDKVIMGLPLGLDGQNNVNTERVNRFAAEVKNKTKVSVELFDERFSSQQADRSKGGVSRDEKAAMIILDDWLQKKYK